MESRFGSAIDVQHENILRMIHSLKQTFELVRIFMSENSVRE